MAKEVGVEMVEVARNVEGEEEDGLGGDGFVVDGGRSPSTSSRDGEDGGENGIVKKGKTQEVGVKMSKNCALFIEEDGQELCTI
ncbi:hypothetical protein Tco_0672801 [Tanacetum coccineum]